MEDSVQTRSLDFGRWPWLDESCIAVSGRTQNRRRAHQHLLDESVSYILGGNRLQQHMNIWLLVNKLKYFKYFSNILVIYFEKYTIAIPKKFNATRRYTKWYAWLIFAPYKALNTL